MSIIQEGRVRFVKTTMRTQVLKMYPWAKYTLRMDGGFYCFETEEDLNIYKEKMKWELSKENAGGPI